MSNIFYFFEKLVPKELENLFSHKYPLQSKAFVLVSICWQKLLLFFIDVMKAITNQFLPIFLLTKVGQGFKCTRSKTIICYSDTPPIHEKLAQ